jgi:5-methylcytosine-specific restriction endonuclease McrA
MTSKYWLKLPVSILDDPKWGMLDDATWCNKIKNMLRDPNNWHCDTISSERYGWSLVRKARTRDVFDRDEHKCRYCGSTNNLEIDHIYPLARGGSNDLDNLQILCKSCNCKKWANIP